MPCSKVKYSLREARSVLNEAKSKHKKYRREIRVYHCNLCNAHHLTSKKEHEEVEVIPLEELVYKDEWLSLMK